MTITRVEPFILHVPVTRNEIADSTHVVNHWGMPGVLLHTDDGAVGCGYTGTHAHLPTDRLITDCIAHTYGSLLLGEDPRRVQHLWDKLARFPPALWVGRSGITQMALSAVDIALWDLKAKAAGQPLWQLLGGSDEARLEAYNTDGGWLNWSTQQLIDDGRRMVEEEGFRGVKIKVGRDRQDEDIERLRAVRQAIGPYTPLMVDANATNIGLNKMQAYFLEHVQELLQLVLTFPAGQGNLDRLAQLLVSGVVVGLNRLFHPEQVELLHRSDSRNRLSHRPLLVGNCAAGQGFHVKLHTMTWVW